MLEVRVGRAGALRPCRAEPCRYRADHVVEPLLAPQAGERKLDGVADAPQDGVVDARGIRDPQQRRDIAGTGAEIGARRAAITLWARRAGGTDCTGRPRLSIDAIAPVLARGARGADLPVDAVLAILPRRTVAAGRAVFARGSSRTSGATLTGRTRLPIDAVLAVLPGRAVTACRAVFPWCSSRTSRPALTGRTRLPVDAVLAILPRRTVTACRAVFARFSSGTGEATLTSRATLTGRTTLTRWATRTISARDPAWPGGRRFTTASGRNATEPDEIRDAGCESLAAPEVQFALHALVVIPHPEQPGVLLVLGIPDRSFSRETLVVIDKSMNGLDGRELGNSHGAEPPR
ncbi:MAG: hypothetical protein ACKO9B_00705 [Planctomycetota bacterium]